MKVETFFLAEFAKLFLDESSGLEIKIAVYTLGQQVPIFSYVSGTFVSFLASLGQKSSVLCMFAYLPKRPQN